MLTEKQLLELIKALQSSQLSIWEIIGVVIIAILFLVAMNYIISMVTEKAKNTIANANYEKLHNQLSQNTQTIKEIERKITSELWVSQQVWQKKYDLYEYIHAQLLNIKKWVDNESYLVELHMVPHYLASSYHGYLSDEDEKIFWKEVQEAHDELNKTLDDKVVKEKNKELQQKLSNAMSSLTEIMITKSILLNSKVSLILITLIKDIGIDPSPQSYEDPDDYGSRIKHAIDSALLQIKNIAISDLEIKNKDNLEDI